MAQQTALEYLFEQLWETPKDKFTWNAILEKAKEKEKQIKIRTSKTTSFHWWFFYIFAPWKKNIKSSALEQL